MFAVFQLNEIIDKALSEDLGTGDLSSAILPESLQGYAQIYAKEPGVVAGLPIVTQVFKRLDANLMIHSLADEGQQVQPGSVVLEVEGSLRSVLQAERTALNFLQHLSGIATATRKAVEQLSGMNVQVTDTRKTLPGLRMLQKYAVQLGGGKNHRFGLYDAVMLKDNHIAALGGISPAVAEVRAQVGHMVKIEVECENLAQVEEASANDVDVIMLDNMSLDDMRAAVRLVNHRALVEASGGIREENLRQVAETGVDLISIGALTHSVKVLDFSLDVGQMKASAAARWEKESRVDDGT